MNEQLILPGLYIVPSEPTIEMADAGCRYAEAECGIDAIMGDEVAGIYRAMLSVAPPYHNGVPMPMLPTHLEAEVKRAEQALHLLKVLRKLAGYVENGSNETVKIFQDDATRSWHVSVGNRYWYGGSIEGALSAAEKEIEP